MFLVYQAPSYEPKVIWLAWFLHGLAYLSMLLIPELARTASSADQLRNNQHARIKQFC